MLCIPSAKKPSAKPIRAICSQKILSLISGPNARRAGWHYMVAAQPFVGGVGLTVSGVLLALVVINVIIWVLLFAVVVALALAFIGALLSG